MNSDFLNKVTLIDCLNGLDILDEESVHCVVTSPPYWALRDYGAKVISEFPEVTFSILGMPMTIPTWIGQLGHESTPIEFVGHIVYIFRKVHKILRKDGTCWVNFGDSYASKSNIFLKPKDLCGIPWTVAIALRDDGWYLRQDIIWSKLNPMPESVKDRCTKAHEYIFMLSKSEKYFYDAEAIKTPAKNPIDDIRRKTKASLEGKYTPDSLKNGIRKKDKQRGHSQRHAGFNDRWDQMDKEDQMSIGANKRSVWEIATRPFSDAHFATYPPDLIIDCIKAGCPEYICPNCGIPFYPNYEKNLVPTKKAIKTSVIDKRDHSADEKDQGSNRKKDGHKNGYIYESLLIGYKQSCNCIITKPSAGIVLDPFSGSNTTGIVAKKLNRNYISFEINPDYQPIYEKRTYQELGLFN